MNADASLVRRFAVIGSPISHSQSPVLHRAFYEFLGETSVEFGAEQVDLDSFAGFWGDAASKFAGLSVTMPLKSAVAAAADHVHGVAATIGIANTVVFRCDGAHAYNTDVTGLVRVIGESAARHASAVVFGSGGTAASALVALREAGVGAATVVARDLARAEVLAEMVADLDIAAVPWADSSSLPLSFDIVVSTVPSNAARDIVQALPQGLSAGLLVDLAYGGDESVTSMLQERCAVVVDGRECLVQQGADQVVLHLGLPSSGNAAELRRQQLVSAGRRALGL